MTDSDGIVSLDEAADAQEMQEATEVARIGVWAVPVVLVHLALLYAFARAAFDFELPAFLHVDGVVAWMWVNGGAIGLGVWLWKKGRVPIAAGKWLHGRRARILILMWLGASLAWFLLPALLSSAWESFAARSNDW